MASSSADRSPGRHLDPADLADRVREHWGLDGDVAPLGGYDDRNARLTTPGGDRFVLKSSPTTPGRPLLEAQHRVLHRLGAEGPPGRFPRPVPSRSGDEIVEVDGPDGPRLVRVLRWVEGTALSTVRPHRPDQLTAAGRILATVDRALRTVEEPAAQRVTDWDLRRGREVVESGLHRQPDPERRTRLERVLELYRERVVPLESDLPTGLIHGDGHDDNLMVEPVGEDLLAPRRIVGLIDFGDLVHSWRVAEPAIAAAYLMMGKADPLAAAERVVAGYHDVHPLGEPELEALFPLARLRLAVSVTLSERRRREGRIDPYLFASEDPAWALLEELDGLPPELALYGVRGACGLSPVPRTSAVVAWLSAHPETVGPVLDSDPRSAIRHTLDLSVGSVEIGGLDGADPPERWARAVEGRLEEHGATVGIGLYDEARRWYVGDLYRDEGEDGPRWRTVHTGVDLFVPAGTPVLAPLPGTVHSARENPGPGDYGPTVVLRHEPRDGVIFHTLFGHLDRASLDGVRTGDEVERGTVLGRVGPPPENGGWAPHLHLQLVVDMLGRNGEFPGVCRPDRRGLWLSLSPDPNLLLQLPEGCTASRPPSDGVLREERRRRLGPNLSLSYRTPVHVARGRGAHLWDVDGRRFLDCVNNIAHVGHAHPRVVRALHRQASVLNTNTRYLHGSILEYARRLTGLFPDPLRVLWLVNSGSEANELALRLARTHTGRREVLVQEGAYHGNTTSTVALSPYKFDGPGGRGPEPWVRVTPMPDPYRGRHRGSDAGAAYAREVEARCEGVAAFFAEPILSCGGQVEPPPGYLAAAFRAVREAGGLTVADEVQVGFGRVGSHWWGFETQDAVPDIVTLGKPMGNGHPMGAVVTTAAVARSFDTGMEYFSSFGGNPVSCEVGIAVLDVIEEEGLRGRARAVGSLLERSLRDLAERHGVVGDVRGRGLFLGLELVEDREARTPAPRHARYVVERAREHGVLLSTDGPDHNVIKIKPPLAFDEEDARTLLEVLDRILDEDPVRRPPPSTAPA